MKRNIKWRGIFLLAVTAVWVYYLIPTLFPGRLVPSLAPPFPLVDKINLGLDLQGGIHLVYEVDTEKVVEKVLERGMAEAARLLDREKVGVAKMERQGPGTVRVQLLRAADRENALKALRELSNLERSVGGEPTEVLLTLSSKQINEYARSAVDQGLEKIRNRVDQFGVAEPHIVREGERRIVVQLPGIKEPERAKRLIGETALLEFKLLDEEGDYNTRLAEGLRGKVPEGDEVLYSEEKDDTGNVIGRAPYLVKKKTLLTGDSLTSAAVEADQRTPGAWVVAFGWDREGSRIFGGVTEANIGKRLAIILDNRVKSAPRINSKITDRGIIEGNFTAESARDLAIVLRTGALPAPMNPIADLTVGPSLGQDSIQAGVRAAILGGALVVLFMGIYYKLSGLIADAALVLNLVWLVGILAAIRATLTLPGIAGVILGIGMAVDSNVLILERIREELKLGKTIRASIDAGYDKAFWTIIDSHVTTLITAAALFLFGTGPIRGFAVTLFIGVTINLVTAIVGTRLVYDWMIRRRDMKTLSI